MIQKHHQQLLLVIVILILKISKKMQVEILSLIAENKTMTCKLHTKDRRDYSTLLSPKFGISPLTPGESFVNVTVTPTIHVGWISGDSSYLIGLLGEKVLPVRTFVGQVPLVGL
jgi:hypothetical protein